MLLTLLTIARGGLNIAWSRGLAYGVLVMLLYLVIRDHLTEVGLVYALLSLRNNLNVLCIVTFHKIAGIAATINTVSLS